MKKIIALVLVVVMMMAMGSVALADGTDGSVTIENATIGVTYKAYKVFDATYDGDNIAYTVNATLFAALGGTAGTNLSAGPFTISGTADAAGNYNVQLTNDSTDAATIATWIGENLSKFTEVTSTAGLDSDKKATDNTVVFGSLAYGYYYVTSGLGSVVTVDSAKKDVTVKDKNPSTPTGPDKVITAEDAVIDTSDQTGLNAESNDAAVGSKESFKITYTATNYVTSGTGTNVESKKVTKFYIEDQPNNMTIDPATVAVTVGTTSVIANGVVVNNTTNPATVSVAEGDEGKLEITIDWVDDDEDSIYAAADGKANITVTLTYEATILAAAATENADNTVTVKYDRTGEPNIDLGTDTNETDTYKFKLEKTDNSGTGLTGAKFELTLGNTKVSFIDVNNDGTVFRVAGVGETGTTIIDLKNNSITEIQGLDKQAYTLTEIEAPKGYNLLTSTISVAETDLTVADETIPATKKITVINVQGTELPSTGGIGTTIFYIVGGLLLVGAAIVLVARRKAEN